MILVTPPVHETLAEAPIARRPLAFEGIIVFICPSSPGPRLSPSVPAHSRLALTTLTLSLCARIGTLTLAAPTWSLAMRALCGSRLLRLRCCPAERLDSNVVGLDVVTRSLLPACQPRLDPDAVDVVTRSLCTDSRLDLELALCTASCLDPACPEPRLDADVALPGVVPLLHAASRLGLGVSVVVQRSLGCTGLALALRCETFRSSAVDASPTTMGSAMSDMHLLDRYAKPTVFACSCALSSR